MGSDQIIPVVGHPSPAASTLQQNSITRRTLFRSFFLNHYPVSFWRKVVSELVSTFLLVFMTCGAAAISSTDEKRISQLGASIVGGLIVTVMIYAVGHISGAHMNPAVTLAFATFRHFPFKHVPFYWAAQVTGATVSAFTLRALLHPIKLIGTTSPSGTAAQALVTEIVVTFNMMFVTLAVATDNIGSDNAPGAVGELAGLAVGSAVCITSIFAGPISGGSMNPARTIGPAIASSYYEAIWVYLVGPVTGTLLAGCVYTFIRLNPRPRPSKSGPTPSNSLRIKSFCNHPQNQNSILNQSINNE